MTTPVSRFPLFSIMRDTIVPVTGAMGGGGTVVLTGFHSLAIGAGGWLTGMDIAADGTQVVRTDTYGCYRLVGSTWRQLVTATSMPPAEVTIDVNHGEGVYEIKIAPSNTRILYMCYIGYVYRSDNQGANWVRTAFSHVTTMAPNTGERMFAQKMAIDPINPDVVYVGTQSPGGLFVTFDGGDSWSHIGSIDPGGGVGVIGIAFDPDSGSTGGKTNVIYAASNGIGVYRSADAGATWTLTSSGPTGVCSCTVSNNIYFAAVNANAVWKYKSGVWTNTTPSGFAGCQNVSVDPNNTNRVIAISPAGYLRESLDEGDTWGEQGFGTVLQSSDVPWLTTTDVYMSVGGTQYDPLVANKLWVSAGVGVWHAILPTPIVFSTPIDYISLSAGIEQLVANDIISPPGGKPLVASWDRAFFYVADPDVYPTYYSPVYVGINAGWNMDWLASNPSYVVGIANWFGVQKAGYSTDGGVNWNVFGSTPASIAAGQVGGSMAVGAAGNICWFPENNGNPYYTLDGGNSWTQITISGVPTSGETGWGWAYFLNRHIAAADKVTPGTFYAYNYLSGTYKSVDGGVNWTHVSTAIPANSGFNAKMKSVPGHAGHLFRCVGQVDSASNPEPTAFFEKSVDGGANWTDVSGVLEVYDFGFGKEAPGGSYPCIYIAGFVNSNWGVWQSKDAGAGWSLLTVWPNDSLDVVKTVSGDMNAYGRVYLGFQGSGYCYGDAVDAAVPPIILSTIVTPTLTGGIVEWALNELGTMEILYGLTSAYGSSVSDPVLRTSGSLAITGFSTSTFIHYALVPAGADGASSQTNDARFLTVDVTPPSKVTGLVATAIASSKITLSDFIATDDVGIAYYQIFRDASLVGTCVAAPYTDTNLVASTSYTYTVSAVDAAGNVGALSDPETEATQAGVVFVFTSGPAVRKNGFASNTETYLAQSIGAAAADRVVVVCVGNETGFTNGGVSGVTIGGVAATKVITSAPALDYASIWSLAVPTGTTADVVITTPGVWDLNGIVVGALYGAASATPAHTGIHAREPVEDPQCIPSTAGNVPANVTVPTNGVAVVFFGSGLHGPQVPYWSALTYADSYQENLNGNTWAVMAAHGYEIGSQTYTVQGGTAPGTGTGFSFQNGSGVVASWAH